MNLGILNTVIAMVIVLLVLSLLVQSVQMFLKKVLKLKSNQIAESLEDLYEQALSQTTTEPQLTGSVPSANDNSPAKQASDKSPAKQFRDTILEEFRSIGRESKWGHVVLDSLSKEDLLKIMAKLESESLVPDYKEKFQDMYDELDKLKNAIEALASNANLTGATSSKVAEIRVILSPIFNDVQSILEGGKVKPKVLFGDLLRLGKLKLIGVPELLNDAQAAINQEIQVAFTSNPALVPNLRAFSTELAKIAGLVGNLSQKFDNAVAPLRIRMEQVETWYDTVMQSFDECYARHMRSVAIYISIVVVVLLNANFFTVYSSLSKNDVQRNLIVQSGQKLIEKPSASPTPIPTPAPGTTPTQTPSPIRAAAPAPNTPALAGAAVSPTATPTALPTPVASPTVDIVKEAKETKETIDVYVNTYQQFGFAPLSTEQVNAWFWSVFKQTVVRNEKGVALNTDKPVGIPIPSDCNEESLVKQGEKKVNCTAAWRAQTGTEWWASRGHDVSVLFGWAIMVLLLSVGAPFWQDTLEALFGVKNLLRQKSGTQNIEKQSGEGQPRT